MWGKGINVLTFIIFHNADGGTMMSMSPALSGIPYSASLLFSEFGKAIIVVQLLIYYSILKVYQYIYLR